MLWFLFGISAAVFAISFIRDKRSFRNVFFLLAALVFLVAAVNSSRGNVMPALLTLVFILAAIAVLVMPVVFIWAGVITIRKEGFSLAHSLSILFAFAMWGAMGVIVLSVTLHVTSTVVLSLLVLLSMACLYILSTFMGFLIYSELCLILPKRRKCDFVIVHGAGLLRGCEVSPLLRARLDKGAAVYRRSGAGTKIIVSGGQGGNETVTEASAMSAYLLGIGIPEHDIIPEDQSKNTWQNIRNSKQIIDSLKPGSRVVFVTKNYHVFRTGYYAFKQHLKAEGVGCRTAFYYWPTAFIREYIAIIKREKIMPVILLALWMIGTAISFSTFNP